MLSIPGGLTVTGMSTHMKNTNGSLTVRILIGIMALITAALIAAVFFDIIFPPFFSYPSDKTVTDEETDFTVTEYGRRITVSHDKDVIWELSKDVKAQDFLFEDIDRDGKKELAILCWKRGRYGSKRPTWVEKDELKWSQHIFIYRIENDRVMPRWMASDIGIRAASWEFKDGVFLITDTNDEVTKWRWIHWGLEKM